MDVLSLVSLVVLCRAGVEIVLKVVSHTTKKCTSFLPASATLFPSGTWVAMAARELARAASGSRSCAAVFVSAGTMPASLLLHYESGCYRVLLAD